VGCPMRDHQLETFSVLSAQPLSDYAARRRFATPQPRNGCCPGRSQRRRPDSRPPLRGLETTLHRASSAWVARTRPGRCRRGPGRTAREAVRSLRNGTR
jgi:hypothetical protein